MSDVVGETVRRRSFQTLDGLRGVAAIVVVFHHYRPFLRPLSVGSPHLAVDVFFAMSGFVLALAYGDRLAGDMGPGTFLRLRIVRLYPLYALSLLIALVAPLGALLLGSARNWTPGELALVGGLSLLLLPSPAVSGRLPTLYPLNPPVWSIFFELVVNVAFALCARWSDRALAGLVAVAGGMLLLTGWGPLGLDLGWTWPQAPVGLLRVVFSFFLGVLGFRAFLAGTLPTPRVPAWLPVAVIGVLLCAAPPAGWRGGYDLLCVIVLFPPLLWLCVVNEPRRGVRAYAALGLISYPLYVLHVPVQLVLLSTLDRLLHGRAMAAAPVSGVVTLLLVMAGSLMLARFYDGRARRWLAARLPSFA